METKSLRISTSFRLPADVLSALKEQAKQANRSLNNYVECIGAPDKPCGVGRADANPKLLLNDT